MGMLYWFVLIQVPCPGELISLISDDIRSPELGSSGSPAGSGRFQMLSGAKRPLPPDGGFGVQQSVPGVGALPAAGGAGGGVGRGGAGAGAGRRGPAGAVAL